MSHRFFEAQKYFFALFNFLKMVIRFDLDQCYETRKITAMFQRCLTLLI